MEIRDRQGVSWLFREKSGVGGGGEQLFGRGVLLDYAVVSEVGGK